MAHAPIDTRFSPDVAASEDDSIKSLFQRLLADGKDFVHAEVDLYKTKATLVGKDLGIAAGLGIGAIILADAAVIALLVGLVMTLDRAGLGPGAATAVVVLVTLVIAAVIGFFAYTRAKRALSPAPSASTGVPHG